MNSEIDSRMPSTSSTWQLWYSDMFDRDAVPSLQATGSNIIQGLYELWLYTLKEAILDNGSASFSRFQLTWGNTASTRVDVYVKPFSNLSLTKLRQWAKLMSQDQAREENRREVLLLRLAHLHYELLQNSRRWKASAVDWSAESRELLTRIGSMKDPNEL
jgi:hypothetical protein